MQFVCDKSANKTYYTWSDFKEKDWSVLFKSVLKERKEKRENLHYEAYAPNSYVQTYF